MVHRALLSGDFETREGKPVIQFFYGRVWPMPSIDELLQALAISEKALRIMAKNETLPEKLDLVRREWWAGAALGACACRRGLAFYNHPAAGTPPERREKLIEAIDMLEQVWLERNRPSDWADSKSRYFPD